MLYKHCLSAPELNCDRGWLQLDMRLVLICAAHVYVLFLLGFFFFLFFLFFFFSKTHRFVIQCTELANYTHAEEILNLNNKSSSDRMTKLYAGYSMMLIPVLPRWSCSLHYVIQPPNSSTRVWKAKRRLYWEPVKNKCANLHTAVSKCSLNHSFVKKKKVKQILVSIRYV